ncbi:MAG: hypothetical protein K4571_13600 [Deltaproteobacteria bacterium]
MKTSHFTVICLLLALILLFPGLGLSATISPEESGRILSRIYSKYIPIYAKYRGVESTSKNIIREYDAGTRALKSTSEVTVRRKDYFYDEPEVKVLFYKKDGRDKAPSDYRSRETKPGYLVFDQKGTDHYTLKIMDKKMIGKRECYRIVVVPKKATARHFRGEVFCTTDTLDIVRTVGGAGGLEFPIKHFWAAFTYTLVGNVPVAQAGTIEVGLDVPILYPDMLIVTDTTVIESRLLE